VKQKQHSSQPKWAKGLQTVSVCGAFQEVLWTSFTPIESHFSLLEAYAVVGKIG